MLTDQFKESLKIIELRTPAGARQLSAFLTRLGFVFKKYNPHNPLVHETANSSFYVKGKSIFSAKNIHFVIIFDSGCININEGYVNSLDSKKVDDKYLRAIRLLRELSC